MVEGWEADLTETKPNKQNLYTTEGAGKFPSFVNLIHLTRFAHSFGIERAHCAA